MNNIRIIFKFTALENTFNEFYIQTPNSGQYIYLKNNRYCKFSNMTQVPNQDWCSKIFNINDVDWSGFKKINQTRLIMRKPAIVCCYD